MTTVEELERQGFSFKPIAGCSDIVLGIPPTQRRCQSGSHRYEERTDEELVNSGDAGLKDLTPYDLSPGVKVRNEVTFRRTDSR